MKRQVTMISSSNFILFHIFTMFISGTKSIQAPSTSKRKFIRPLHFSYGSGTSLSVLPRSRRRLTCSGTSTNLVTYIFKSSGTIPYFPPTITSVSTEAIETISQVPPSKFRSHESLIAPISDQSNGCKNNSHTSA